MNLDGFFLGANTPVGFYSLYETQLRRYRKLYILKGGPGCGKSTFIKAVIEALSVRGEDFEPISCSSDPDSLDGAVFPALDAAIVDGTAPHVFEPKYALSGQYYIDMSRFADLDSISVNRQEIERLTDGYKVHYANAYSLLKSVGALEELKRKLTSGAAARIAARAEGIIRRELKGTDKNVIAGKTTCRFLDSICHRGHVFRFERACDLCDRVYEIRSDFATGWELIRVIGAAALQRGFHTVSCTSPLSPAVPAHLLIPRLKLAFLTVPSGCPLPVPPVKTIIADRAIHTKEFFSQRPLLTAAAKSEKTMLTLVQSELKHAYDLHEELETCYSEHIDFDALHRYAVKTADRILLS